MAMSVGTALSEGYLTGLDGGYNGIGDNWEAIPGANLQGHIPQQHEDWTEYLNYDLALSPRSADLGSAGSAGGDSDPGTNAMNQGGFSNGYTHSSYHLEGSSYSSAISSSTGLPSYIPSFPGPSSVQGGQSQDIRPPYTSAPYLSMVDSVNYQPTIGLNAEGSFGPGGPSISNGTNLEADLGAQPAYPNLDSAPQPPLYCDPGLITHSDSDHQHAGAEGTTSYLQNPLESSPSPTTTERVSGRPDTVGVSGSVSELGGGTTTTDNVTLSILGGFGGSNGMPDGDSLVFEGQTTVPEPTETTAVAGPEQDSRSSSEAPNDLNQGDDLDTGEGNSHTTPMNEPPPPPAPTRELPCVIMGWTGPEEIVNFFPRYTRPSNAPTPPGAVPAPVTPNSQAGSKKRERREEDVEDDLDNGTGEYFFHRTKIEARGRRKRRKIEIPQVSSNKGKQRATSVISEDDYQVPSGSFDNSVTSSSSSPMSLPPIATLSCASSSSQESSSPSSNNSVYYADATSAGSSSWEQRGEREAKDNAGPMLARAMQVNAGSSTGPGTILGTSGTGNRSGMKKRNTRIPSPIPGLTKGLRGRRVPRVPTTDANKPEETIADRQFVCKTPECYKAFGRKEHLQRHMRCVHSNERKYLCTYDGCGRYFSRQDNLVQHSRNVHFRDPERPPTTTTPTSRNHWYPQRPLL